MRIALVCIAKDEENYIEEWVKYHIKLGFDKIFIYENDWDCSLNLDKVIKIKFNGNKQQVLAYNHFISTFKNEYDWVAFFDVDEFLVLKKHKNIQDFIKDYSNESAIGINWVLFGDNGCKYDGTHSVINRFTKRQELPNIHIKTIVKLKDVKEMFIHHHNGACVDTNYKRIDNTPFNYLGTIDTAQINHYFVKTKEEFIKKINRGRAGNGGYRNISEFDSHNKNEVDDLTAFNFFNT